MHVSVGEFVVHAPRWSPGFSERIRGASVQELQELAQLVGFPLPALYEEFLARRGHGDGGLNLAHQGTMDVSDIIKIYRLRISRGEPPPPHCIILGIGMREGDVCLEVVPGSEPRVVFTDGDEVSALYAESLMGLLFRQAHSVESKTAVWWSSRGSRTSA